MCGIGGYSLSSEGNLNIEILKKISTKISHRGPDDNGIYQDSKSKIDEKSKSIYSLPFDNVKNLN